MEGQCLKHVSTSEAGRPIPWRGCGRQETSESIPTSDIENGLNMRSSKGSHGLSMYTWLCVLLSTVSAMLMGYDIGIMSGALLFVRESLRLNELQVEVIVGSLNLVAAVGSLVSGHVAGRLGRRRALLMSSLLFLLGNVVLAVSPNFLCLLAGRVVTGLGVGFAMMIAPLYSAEISPASLRGFLVSWTDVFVNVGILLGYLFGFAFEFVSPRYNWRLMLGAGALPAMFLGAAVLLKVLPESPRWLVLQGREDEAREVMKRVVCNGDEEEAQERLDEILAANKEELQQQVEEKMHITNDVQAGSSARPVYLVLKIRRLLASPLARMYMIAIAINFFQQASGIDALVYYSPVVFGQAGIQSKAGKLGATVGMGVTKLTFVLVATSLLDRVGRKKLLYYSAGGVAACLSSVAGTFMLMGLNSAKGDSMLSVAVKANAHPISPMAVAITILAVFAYVAFFSIGLGPISYVLTSEVFPLRHRSTAVGVSIFVNRAVSGSVALIFLTIAKAITPAGTFLLFAGITVLGILFVWLVVPETKGKSLEEIAHYLSAKSDGLPAASTEMQPAQY
ncbi:hypothetical protein GOP47_0001002 [Adiantum capillus-veneris]|uniref:Major facilitator superfamily (MFS) profile domain-containing protein n=1 Tax=Adiantum capillus-veneris TaxID=13818 RepID=A0A9D4ZR91_ADICA|nr:hypothetical protein GOP47_0001002 [Adiantum capillus-veneris]